MKNISYFKTTASIDRINNLKYIENSFNNNFSNLIDKAKYQR